LHVGKLKGGHSESGSSRRTSIGFWLPCARVSFFSLAELNQAIAELLVKLNQRPFRKIPGPATSDVIVAIHVKSLMRINTIGHRGRPYGALLAAEEWAFRKVALFRAGESIAGAGGLPATGDPSKNY
jgi:hypothetical protein